MFKIGIKNEIVLGNSIRCYGCSVKSKHAIGLKHQTQALMGATRLASGIFQQPRPASGKDSAII